MNSYTSIYIPRMSIYHGEQEIINVMTHYRIGTVSHIDFTPINKKPGFEESIDGIFKAAFVHFSDPCLCSDEQYHYKSRIIPGNEEFWFAMESGKSFKLKISENEYWLCLRNLNPVKRTLMNIHQVVESGRHVENLIQEQSKKIKQLENNIIQLQNVVSQLIGGLYCQTTQRNVIFEMLSELRGENHDQEYIITAEQDTNIWSSYPTTRQGDSCEHRISILEQILGVSKKVAEEQDSSLLARKYKNEYEEADDNSTINSELIADNTWSENLRDIEEAVDRERELDMEDDV